MKISIYDTTLRDGVQSEGISFSVEDKLAITEYLDSIGIDFIEGGMPASNPKDFEFFTRAKKLQLKNSKLVAFTSTHKPGIPCEHDKNFEKILSVETEYVTVFGKCWDMHVTEILSTSLEENLALISETIYYFIKNGKKVFFDAEHFFDGYKHNPLYALSTIKAACDSGAEMIVLCDTNGGFFPFEIEDIINKVRSEINCKIAIHSHNDTGMADANAITAVKCGAVCVQGTFGGYGERCGNANLCTIIPDLQLKLGYRCIPNENIIKLTKISRAICETANVGQYPHAPYVGHSAFTHKGGIHSDAVSKNTASYEHISPELVGNKRRFITNEMSGRSALMPVIHRVAPNLNKDSKKTKNLLEKMKEMEQNGYDFEAAEGSTQLLVLRELGKFTPHFSLAKVNVFITLPGNGEGAIANIKISVDGKYEITSAEGDGPVNALDSALRKALVVFYPQVKNMYLSDFKVRCIDSGNGSASSVRVLISSTDGNTTWRTVGASTDIIEASWKALVDSVEYYLGGFAK